MITLERDKGTDAIVALEWGTTGLHVAAKSVLLVSRPPSGKCKVVNVYWDPVIEKAVFEFDDEPVQ